MNLLMTRQAGLHRRRLLLVAEVGAEGRWVGQRGDAVVGAEARLAQAQRAEDGRVLAGHREEGVGLGGRQLEHGGGRARLLHLPGRHGPRICQ